MLGKVEGKKEREVDSSTYERTEVLNKSLRNRNENFMAATVHSGNICRLVCLCVIDSYDKSDATIHIHKLYSTNIFINLAIATFLEIDLIAQSCSFICCN